MPTVIVYGPGTQDFSLISEVPRKLSEAFGCEGYVLHWHRREMISLGYLHLTEEPYQPRAPFVAADAVTGRAVEQMEVYSLQEAMLLAALHPEARAVAKQMPQGALAIFAAITQLADDIHGRNSRAGWWTDLETGEDLHGKRNMGELLALVHSEVSEALEGDPSQAAVLARVHSALSRALEGVRKNLPDDKLPHRPMFRVELVDAIYRIFDILGSEQNDEHPAGAIFLEKVFYNANRPDHKPENRIAAGGKKF
jgi:hypothetical protein